MLSKNDIQILRDMFAENNQILKREIRDETQALIAVSESRMMKRMDTMKEEIIDGITDVLDESVFPKLEEHDRAITRINKQLRFA